MRVVEIFSSIEGEGKRAGELCTFIRLAGCNLRCSYCDTPYAQKKDSEATEMHVIDIIEKVADLNNKNVTVTGGEPLIHEDIEDLLYMLNISGFYTNVETNGSMPIAKYKISPAYGSVFFTMDYKCLSSGMNAHMHCGCITPTLDLGVNDVLKFVVGDRVDMEQCLTFRKLPCQKYLSPVFGKIEPKEIVEFMKEKDLQNYKIQIQMHKVIYPPEMRGV